MKRRIVYIDYLKIAAMFGVVLSHSLAMDLAKTKFTPQWTVSNIFLSFISPAVGLFFMVSGALILSSPRTNDIHYVLGHRLVRILIPFIIWSAISVAVMMNLSNSFSWHLWGKRVLMMYHQYPIIPYWFLYPLLGFYLLSPMLKVFVDHANKKTLDYIIGLWFVTNIFLPFVADSLPSNIAVYFQYSPGFNLVILGQTLGYFLLGYRLSQMTIKKNSLHTNVAAMILLFLITIVANFENHLFNWKIQVIGYTSIFAILLSSEIFLVVKKYENLHPVSSRTKRHRIMEMSGLTYGIYLTHSIAVQTLEQYFRLQNSLVVFVIASIACVAFTYALSKVRGLRFFLLGMD